MKLKLPLEIDNIFDLLEKIKEKNPEIIAIDGEDGNGKTTLAEFLAKKLKVFDHVKLDSFIYRKNAGYYNINLKKLKIKIQTLKKKFIIEGLLILKYLKKLKTLKKTDFFLIYVENNLLKEYKEWEEDWGRYYKKTLKEIINYEEKNTTFINQALNSNNKIYRLKGLRKQILVYKYYFKPWRKADVIFLNSLNG